MAERIPSPYGVDYNYSFPRAKIEIIPETCKDFRDNFYQDGLLYFVLKTFHLMLNKTHRSSLCILVLRLSNFGCHNIVAPQI